MQKQQKLLEIEFNDELHHALAFARRCGSLKGGLELIQATLTTEEAGIELVESKKKKVSSQIERKRVAGTDTRITRILLVSNDGSDRFYRHCERLLENYPHRLLGFKLNVSSSILGSAFFGKDKAVKALLVTRRNAAEKVLLVV